MLKKETDMFPSVRQLLENNGYNVNAEVEKCDIIATKNEEILVCEMKLSFNISLLYQLIDRKAITSNVYAVIPRPKSYKARKTRYMLDILKQLGFGLITVSDLDIMIAEVILTPDSNMKNTARGKKTKKRIISQIEGRNCDTNIAGSVGKKIVTAYREASINAMCIAEANGMVQTKQCDPVTKKALQTNYYGFFLRIQRGCYSLTQKGKDYLNGEEFKDVISFYRDKAKQFEKKPS